VYTNGAGAPSAARPEAVANRAPDSFTAPVETTRAVAAGAVRRRVLESLSEDHIAQLGADALQRSKA